MLLNDETVKVPHMDKSISEDTLKTRRKEVGDAVAVDEAVATIQTDRIYLSVDALRRQDHRVTCKRGGYDDGRAGPLPNRGSQPCLSRHQKRFILLHSRCDRLLARCSLRIKDLQLSYSCRLACRPPWAQATHQ